MLFRSVGVDLQRRRGILSGGKHGETQGCWGFNCRGIGALERAISDAMLRDRDATFRDHDARSFIRGPTMFALGGSSVAPCPLPDKAGRHLWFDGTS